MAAEIGPLVRLHSNTRIVAGSPELVSRNGHLLVGFDAAAVETVEFPYHLALSYVTGNNATGVLTMLAASATSGNVRARVAFEYHAPGAFDFDADGFAADQEVNASADSVSGESFTATWTLSNANMDGWAAGGKGRVRISRVGNDGTNDTMTGDAQFDHFEITQ